MHLLHKINTPAFPQLLIQSFFLIKRDSFQGFVLFSIMFSLLSMVSKAISEDKELFKDGEFGGWREPKWRFKIKYDCICCIPYCCKCVRKQFIIRSFFRVFDMSSRIIIITLAWSIIGGEIIFVFAVFEIMFYCVIAYQTREYVYICFWWYVYNIAINNNKLSFAHFVLMI